MAAKAKPPTSNFTLTERLPLNQCPVRPLQGLPCLPNNIFGVVLEPGQSIVLSRFLDYGRRADRRGVYYTKRLTDEGVTPVRFRLRALPNQPGQQQPNLGLLVERLEVWRSEDGSVEAVADGLLNYVSLTAGKQPAILHQAIPYDEEVGRRLSRKLGDSIRPVMIRRPNLILAREGEVALQCSEALQREANGEHGRNYMVVCVPQTTYEQVELGIRRHPPKPKPPKPVEDTATPAALPMASADTSKIAGRVSVGVLAAMLAVANGEPLPARQNAARQNAAQEQMAELSSATPASSTTPTPWAVKPPRVATQPATNGNGHLANGFVFTRPPVVRLTPPPGEEVPTDNDGDS